MADLTTNDPNNKVQSFPNPVASQEVKLTEDYGLQYGRAIWAMWTRNYIWWNERKQRDIINRKYAEGLESIEKYKDRLDIKGDTSWLNLDFNPTTRIANLVDNVVGRLMAQDYVIQCNPIDPDSKLKQDDDRAAMYTNMKLKPVSDIVEKETGVPLIPKDKPIPDSDEEAELYFQLTYKQQSSLAMEQALAAVFYNTNFEDTKRKVLRDLVVLKKGAIMCSYDENGNIIPSYEDPVDLIYPYSKYEDFRNIPYVAVVKKYNVGELAQLTDKFDEATLFKIAREQAGKNNNPQWQWGNTYEGYYWNSQTYAGRPYDDFNISVMKFYFLSSNKEKYVKKETQGNRMYFDKKNSNYELPKVNDDPNAPATGSKKELLERSIQYLYEGNWIINTNYIFDYKLSDNIPRERVMGAYSPKATLPIIQIKPDIYDMENKSIVERLIPHEDQINLINLKKQQLMILAKPPGIKIDLDGLENVSQGIGQGLNNPIELIKMYNQTGNFVFRSRDKAGNVINSSVIDVLPNGIGKDFALLFEAYNQELQMMNDVIGFNSATDGSTPDPKSLVGVQKLSLNATNSALRPLNFAYIRLIERVAKQLTLMIQDSMEYGNKAFIDSIGRIASETIKYGDKIALNEFGIKVELLPDEEQRAQINNDISTALANQQIKMSDAIMVRQILRQSPKLAEQMLVLREKKNIEEKKAEVRNNAKANADQQVQSSQAAAQSQMQLTQQEEQLKQQQLELEYKLKGILSAQEHQQRMEELALANQGKVAVAHKAGEAGIVKAGVQAHASMNKETAEA